VEPQITVLLIASGTVVLLAGVTTVTWLLGRLSQGATCPRLDREMERAWRKVAGLLEEAAVHQPVHRRPAVLTGRLDGFAVTVRYLPSEGGVRLDIDGGRLLPQSLRIRARQGVLGPGLTTGDVDFDSRVWVEGGEVVVAPLLDATTRALVGEEIARHAASLQYGRLTCVLSPTADADRLRGEIESSVALARRLVEPPDPLVRLATIAGSDPIAAVRLRALQVLVARWPDSTTTKVACEATIRDPDDELRLVAAIGRGGAGEATLADLAGAPHTSEDRAVRALRALGSRLPAERAVALVDDALRLGRRSLASQAIGALGRTGGPLAVSRLLALARGADFDAAVESVRALGATGAASAEATRVELLESGSGDMRAAAAAALGRLGTAAAVGPLRRVVDTHPLDLGLRGTVAGAIALIQERLTGAAPGQLSLAEGESGQLSLLPDGTGGRLSPVDPQDPQV
jgi:hypothetical protein